MQFQRKTPIHSKRNGIGTGHITAHFQNGGTGCFLAAVANILNDHGREPVLVGVGMLLDTGHVSFQAVDQLLKACNLLGELLDDLILQCVPLAQMGGFHKP